MDTNTSQCFPFSIIVTGENETNDYQSYIEASDLHALLECTSFLLENPVSHEQIRWISRDRFRINFASLNDVKFLSSSPAWINCVHPKATVDIETFDVVFQGVKASTCFQVQTQPHLVIAALFSENPLSLSSPVVLNKLTAMPEVGAVRLHLTHCAAADSFLLRGLWFQGRHFACRSFDDLDRSLFWCDRCSRSLHIGYSCAARQHTCRYCMEDHSGRECKARHEDHFVPQCVICRKEHVAWGLECPAMWRMVAKPRCAGTRALKEVKRKASESSIPAKRHRSSPQRNVTLTTKRSLSSLLSPPVADASTTLTPSVSSVQTTIECPSTPSHQSGPLVNLWDPPAAPKAQREKTDFNQPLPSDPWDNVGAAALDDDAFSSFWRANSPSMSNNFVADHADLPLDTTLLSEWLNAANTSAFDFDFS